MARVVGYVRVSTADQNPALQVDALRAAGATEIFEDRASGAKLDRKGLRQALDSLQPGDTLAVWKLDRLGRSLRQLIDVIEEIKTRGCYFRSLTDSIDTTTPGGRVLFSILGALAEFERDTIRERVSAGIASARKGGRAHGRPPRMTAESAHYARDMLAQGHSWNSVARAFSVGKTTLHRALKAHPPETSNAARPLAPSAADAEAEAAPALEITIRRIR